MVCSICKIGGHNKKTCPLGFAPVPVPPAPVPVPALAPVPVPAPAPVPAPKEEFCEESDAKFLNKIHAYLVLNGPTLCCKLGTLPREGCVLPLLELIKKDARIFISGSHGSKLASLEPAPAPAPVAEPVPAWRSPHLKSMMPREYMPIDLERTVENVFMRLIPAEGDIHTPMFIYRFYKQDPKQFVISGDIHTNKEGSKTYISVRWYQTGTMYDTIHLYGALRFGKFIVKSGSFKAFNAVSNWSYVRDGDSS